MCLGDVSEEKKGSEEETIRRAAPRQDTIGVNVSKKLWKKKKGGAKKAKNT